MAEKWVAHDRRSDERWADLMEKLHELTKKMDKCPCVQHGEDMIKLNARIKSIEGWLDKALWAIGVIYVAIIGALIKNWMKL
jgi:hypothetical protein